jgi:hypothetical protein
MAVQRARTNQHAASGLVRHTPRFGNRPADYGRGPQQHHGGITGPLSASHYVPIQAVFNNDIVGGVLGGDGVVDGTSVRLYSEGPTDSPSRALAAFTQRCAMKYVPSHVVRLMALRDRFLRGSDHTAFNLEGFAAVGFRESRERISRNSTTRTICRTVCPFLISPETRV